jgi:hypothetical protein
MRVLAEGAVPVPAQLPAYRKSLAVIALQLIKRWRNLAYDRRHAGVRLPPSVLLAYYVAKNANRTHSLSAELIYQVECMIMALEQANRAGDTVCEVNPTCPEDELDRWPCDVAEQRVFIAELRDFAAKLGQLAQGLPLPKMRQVLQELFGERATATAVRAYGAPIIADDDADAPSTTRERAAYRRSEARWSRPQSAARQGIPSTAIRWWIRL